LGTNGGIGAHQGGLKLSQVSQPSSKSSILQNQFLSLLWGHSNPHDKWGKGENRVFWEQTEKLGSTKGAWKCPNFVNHLPNPQYFKSRCYLPAEGTLTLMTSAEQGENGVFWKQMEILGSTKGA
jgi:hypothetical protein